MLLKLTHGLWKKFQTRVYKYLMHNILYFGTHIFTKEPQRIAIKSAINVTLPLLAASPCATISCPLKSTLLAASGHLHPNSSKSRRIIQRNQVPHLKQAHCRHTWTSTEPISRISSFGQIIEWHNHWYRLWASDFYSHLLRPNQPWRRSEAQPLPNDLCRKPKWAKCCPKRSVYMRSQIKHHHSYI